MHDVIRTRLLRWWAGVVTRRPVAILVIAALLAVAAVGYTVLELGFQSDRNKLVSHDLDWNQRFMAWMETFTSDADLILVVDAGDGDPERAARARALVDEMGPALRQLQWVRDAVWGFDASAAHPRTLRLLPAPEFERRLAEIAESGPVLRNPTPQAMIAEATQAMRAGGGGEVGGGDGPMDLSAMRARIAQFGGLIDRFNLRMRTPADEPVALDPSEEAVAGFTYLSTPNERFLIVRVSPEPDVGTLTPLAPAIRQVRQAIQPLRERYPDVPVGLTGTEVVELDETDAATRDSTIASILAAALIATLLITAFHSVRMPLLLMAPLLLAIAWSFGFLTLAIGHLQVISVVFAVILLGLGVDFGIHLASRYERVRHGHPDDSAGEDAGFRAALNDTFTSVGPGVFTGAITTAVAFGTTLFTDFTGVAEMGLIASAGIVLCLVAMFAVYPALLRLVVSRHGQVTPLQQRKVKVFDERWISPVIARPWVTLGVAAVVVAAALVATTQLRFDYNLLALLPRGVESVEWQQRLVEEGEQSVYFAVSITDSIDEARARAEAMRRLPTVAVVGGIAYMFPGDEEAKLRRVAEARVALEPAVAAAAAAPEAAADQPTLVSQLGGLRVGLVAQLPQAPPPLRGPLSDLIASIDGFLAVTRELDEPERRARLEALQSDYDRWRQRTLELVTLALDPSPIEPDDLPPGLLDPYIGERGGEPRFALEVFADAAAAPEQMLDHGLLTRFVGELRTVDPQVTGVVVQVYESGSLIWRAYMQAGLWALLAVFVLVLLDFRKLQDAVLVMVPVTSGFAATFGVMVVAGVQLNPANIVVMPLIFGIGVDAGVHMLHRYNQQPNDRPLGLVAGTGKGITLTSLTTIIGFACLMTASHRGIASLGFVMATGIAMTLLACLTIMPALLELRTRRRERPVLTEARR
jgi:hopanoid biosynthesis associated RND transporter like protein HpnN